MSKSKYRYRLSKENAKKLLKKIKEYDGTFPDEFLNKIRKQMERTRSEPTKKILEQCLCEAGWKHPRIFPAVPSSLGVYRPPLGHRNTINTEKGATAPGSRLGKIKFPKDPKPF